jgi:hypothetical protein
MQEKLNSSKLSSMSLEKLVETCCVATESGVTQFAHFLSGILDKRFAFVFTVSFSDVCLCFGFWILAY